MTEERSTFRSEETCWAQDPQQDIDQDVTVGADDAADDEKEAAALRQLRDEALSNQFVSGTRDERERILLRRLHMKNRGGRFEVLRREALLVLREDCMLEGDGLKTGSADAGTQGVFTDPVAQQLDLSSDTAGQEKEDAISTLLDGGSQILGCVDVDEGGAEIDAGGHRHESCDEQVDAKDLDAGVLLIAKPVGEGTKRVPELSFEDLLSTNSPQLFTVISLWERKMAVPENHTDGTEEAYSLNKWQRCLFKTKSSVPQPRVHADSLRGILNQLHTASVTHGLSKDVCRQLKTHFADLYSFVVDCSSPESGLNNFADGALALSGSHANESSEWKSCLTVDNVKNMDCVKALLKTSEWPTPGVGQEQVILALLQLAPGSSQKPTEVSLGGSQKFAECNSTTSTTTLFQPPANSSPTFCQVGLYKQCGNFEDTITNTSPSSCQDRLWKLFQHFKVTTTTIVKQPSQSFDTGSRRTFGPRQTFSQQRTPQTPNFPTVSADPRVPVPSAAPNTRPFNSVGVSRSTSAAGSMGYDPTSQLCNLGILGTSNSASGGPPSLKRKFGASGTSFAITVNFRAFFRGPRSRGQEDEEAGDAGGGAFRSARDQLHINNQKKFGNRGGGANGLSSGYGSNRKVLGVTRRGPNSKFVPPVMNKEEGDNNRMSGYKPPGRNGGSGQGLSSNNKEQEPVDERLMNIDPKMVELIMSEIMDHGPPINWDDIAGLEFAKNTIKEIVVWPMLRPDIFTGLRGPPKGLLLFGPPGTGKTLIGKCIACQSGATFFSISASSLTSKWVGEGEKMVRALFAVARCYQPAVIFIDEIDSLLSQRSNDEHESSRRIKTEFLVQLDGATTSSDERLLIVGATNRPQEIDEAARRRLVKRLYIPLPDSPARRQIVCSLLSQQSHSLSEDELEDVCRRTDGYSGADMANLCREAALGPIRSIQGMDIQHITADQVRPILHQDLLDALQNVRPSVAQSDLDVYLQWNSKFGCGSAK
ncbi:fidgetin-like protein 1 [Diadema antillarum]|uniref:fidgetin-like protein 1 n=1 Tax=Diadema antillarum TaxID=105358 RepID=UPI003A8670EF